MEFVISVRRKWRQEMEEKIYELREIVENNDNNNNNNNNNSDVEKTGRRWSNEEKG